MGGALRKRRESGLSRELLNFLKASLILLVAVSCGKPDAGEPAAPPPRPAVEKVSIAAGKKLIDEGIFLLDVRTAPEFARGHIKGAKLIPVRELVRRIWELDHLKEKELLIYCRTARRSAIAMRILADHGFRKICDLEGGIIAWRRAGLPVETGK